MMMSDEAAISKVIEIIDAALEEAEANVLFLNVDQKSIEKSGKFLKKNKKKQFRAVNPFRKAWYQPPLSPNATSIHEHSSCQSSTSPSTSVTHDLSILSLEPERFDSNSSIFTSTDSDAYSTSRISSSIVTEDAPQISSICHSRLYAPPKKDSHRFDAIPKNLSKSRPSESGISFNFTAAVKDPKSGKSHPFNVVANCREGNPARIYINGKAFGPRDDN